MKISTVKQMREMDRTAIEKYGIKDELLMENAGLAAFSAILNEIGIENNSFLVICGGGNNGGDGLVVARKIHSMGGDVNVMLLNDESNFKGAAKMNYEIAKKLSLEMKRLESIEELDDSAAECDVIVDAIFGTGLTRSVEGFYKDVIETINKSHKIVKSMDIPSGIHGDTGKVMGTAVRADITSTYGLPKIGNVLYPGFEFGGALYVTHISFPPELQDNQKIKVEINEPKPIPNRKEDGHKGTFGDVLFIAGAANYFGAPYFSAMSFLKAGGGYARLAAPASVTPVIANKGSEIVFAPQKETSEGSIALASKKALLEIANNVDFVVMGPGLSLNEATQQLVREFAVEINKPLLIDGDGLTAVAQDMSIVKRREAPTILTPHIGEMARISGLEIAEVDENKVPTAQAESEKLEAVVVLKGAHSIIAFPDSKVFINLSGNSGMATAGSGDVLTGTITAMYGLGLPLDEAVRTGVFMHGFAGDLAADEIGEDGMTAEDILEFLPFAMDSYREEYDEIISDFYGNIFVI